LQSTILYCELTLSVNVCIGVVMNVNILHYNITVNYAAIFIMNERKLLRTVMVTSDYS